MFINQSLTRIRFWDDWFGIRTSCQSQQIGYRATSSSKIKVCYDQRVMWRNSQEIIISIYE